MGRRRYPGGPTSARARSQDRVEHRRREAPGEGVLLAHVEAAEQVSELGAAVRQDHLGAVPERRPRRRHRPALLGQRASSSACQPNAPSTTTTRGRDQRPARGARNGPHVRRSSGVGSLAGGAQRTGAVTRTSVRVRPSSRDVEVACDANPVRCIAANRKSPERSPVNIRPVRLAPCAAGARPTTSTARVRVAEARHRPRPVGLVAERGPLLDADELAPRHQPRARPALRDDGVERGEVGRARCGADHVGRTSAQRSPRALVARSRANGPAARPGSTTQPRPPRTPVAGPAAGPSPFSAITGTPVRTASATSLSVPHEPPTLTTTSLDRTSRPLRSSPRPVGIATVTCGFASSRESRGAVRRRPRRPPRHRATPPP